MNQPATTRGQLVASSTVDAIEAALSTALLEAAAAGRFDVVAQLARELEARRQRSAADVVNIAALRSKRLRDQDL